MSENLCSRERQSSPMENTCGREAAGKRGKRGQGTDQTCQSGVRQGASHEGLRDSAG